MARQDPCTGRSNFGSGYAVGWLALFFPFLFLLTSCPRGGFSQILIHIVDGVWVSTRRTPRIQIQTQPKTPATPATPAHLRPLSRLDALPFFFY